MRVITAVTPVVCFDPPVVSHTVTSLLPLVPLLLLLAPSLPLLLLFLHVPVVSTLFPLTSTPAVLPLLPLLPLLPPFGPLLVPLLANRLGLTGKAPLSPARIPVSTPTPPSTALSPTDVGDVGEVVFVDADRTKRSSSSGVNVVESLSLVSSSR
jgi:hypothetical protein